MDKVKQVVKAIEANPGIQLNKLSYASFCMHRDETKAICAKLIAEGKIVYVKAENSRRRFYLMSDYQKIVEKKCKFYRHQIDKLEKSLVEAKGENIK